MSDPKNLDESDFLRLFVKYAAALQAFARVLLPTWDSVDEVLQQASVVMWKKRDQLESETGYLPWAKTIVRFEALRLRRDWARDRHLFSDEVLELLASEATAVPESQWEREQQALRECLDRLEPHHRELVLAPYAGEGRVARIAEQTGRTVNSLYKLLGRLREKITQCVQHRLAMGTEP